MSLTGRTLVDNRAGYQRRGTNQEVEVALDSGATLGVLGAECRGLNRTHGSSSTEGRAMGHPSSSVVFTS